MENLLWSILEFYDFFPMAFLQSTFPNARKIKDLFVHHFNLCSSDNGQVYLLSYSQV